MTVHIVHHGRSMCGLVPEAVVSVPGGAMPMPAEDRWTPITEREVANCTSCIDLLDKRYEIIEQRLVPKHQTAVEAIEARISELETYLKNGTRFMAEGFVRSPLADGSGRDFVNLRIVLDQLETYRFAILELKDVLQILHGLPTELSQDPVHRMFVKG